MQHLKFKPSKYADFMQAANVRTPKYKFHIEIGGLAHDKTILLITGVGAQHLAWPPEFCRALIDGGYRVIRFDNRDIGKSSKMKHKNKLTKRYSQPMRKLLLASRFQVGLSNRGAALPYDLFDMAEDVRQLMDVLALPKTHMIGMSMGGMIAQILAAETPTRVDRLGLIATNDNRPFSRMPSPKSIMRVSNIPKNKASEKAINHIYKTLKSVSSKTYFDENRARQKAQTIYERRFYPKGTRRHVLAVLATGSIRQLSQTIPHKTLVVHGEKDTVQPAANGKNVAKNIRNATYLGIPDMGHEIPIAIAEDIAGHFLRHFDATVT